MGAGARPGIRLLSASPAVTVLLLVLLASGPFGSAAAGEAVLDGNVYVDGNHAIGVTDESYICATMDWWPPEKCDYGTCSWGLASMLNLNLGSPVLLNAVKAFSGLKIRLGGTLQDKVIYDVGDPRPACTPFVRNTSQLFGFSSGCLPMTRWDQLNQFFKESSAEVIFGLNALNGRVQQRDGSMTGAWDCTNAAALIRYTVQKGYNIRGWELGNELCGTGVGVRVGAAQYAADTITLKRVVDAIYAGNTSLPKPLLLAPGGFFDAAWFKDFVDRTKSAGSVDALTHHIYNLGPGVDDHLVEKILNPSYLDGVVKTFSNLQGIISTSGTSARAWVGESGGAYNSGRNHVSNAFVYSFWYLDQLAMAASYDTKAYCRQSLIGGNYGLLNTTTYKPNPDYYSALLWHRLMGRQALSTNFPASKYLRAYAHCAKQSEGIVLLLINLSGNTTMQVTPPKATPRLSSYRKSTSARMPFYQRSSYGGDTREEYHLTPKDGDLHSQTMLLNGNVLDVDQDGNVPTMVPVQMSTAYPIVVKPYSIAFVHIPQFDAQACR